MTMTMTRQTEEQRNRYRVEVVLLAFQSFGYCPLVYEQAVL